MRKLKVSGFLLVFATVVTLGIAIGCGGGAPDGGNQETNTRSKLICDTAPAGKCGGALAPAGRICLEAGVSTASIKSGHCATAVVLKVKNCDLVSYGYTFIRIEEEANKPNASKTFFNAAKDMCESAVSEAGTP